MRTELVGGLYHVTSRDDAVAKPLKEYVADCVDPKESMAKAYRSGD